MAKNQKSLSHEILNPLRKALSINTDKSFYGTFAEIGAGQEVARFFFQAGSASGSVAKAMSAYDMIFSDAIYGKEKSGRYVCEERLQKMLDTEFHLLLERLPHRAKDTRFFAFADTVTTRTFKGGQHLAHGWLGIQFQIKPQGSIHQIILHVKNLDTTVQQQQEAIGLLGLNLVYLAFKGVVDDEQLIDSLTDNLSARRIEIDTIEMSGAEFEKFDNRLIALKLVKRGLTKAVVFDEKGHVKQASDLLYKKPVFVQRGNFRPIGKNHIDIHTQGMKYFNKTLHKDSQETVELMELTMRTLEESGECSPEEFLRIVDSINRAGYKVLLSNFYLFFEVRNFLSRYTDQPIGLTISAKHLDKLFNEKYYQDLSGGILEAFGKLTNKETQLYIYPYSNGKTSISATEFRPKEKELQKFYEYLLDSKKILDIGKV